MTKWEKDFQDEVFEIIYHHYISTGWENTIKMDGIPFPKTIGFSQEEAGECVISAYGVTVEACWNPVTQAWRMESRFDETC